ncbi:hypothetical protein PVAP13_6NG219603 [Panicum virgatum]|uniref:Uncharacterized protein n=1 Tax=Panicum virgatum TaxID=38727 RepID=A0A8T0R089_PANVG|nr:hypothetical protein PVAP13_6NG219603 [Panicum virgatum]
MALAQSALVEVSRTRRTMSRLLPANLPGSLLSSTRPPKAGPYAAPTPSSTDYFQQIDKIPTRPHHPRTHWCLRGFEQAREVAQPKMRHWDHPLPPRLVFRGRQIQPLCVLCLLDHILLDCVL